ncbi:hypothetical protein [Romboutsia ilealis]|uniref:hypothetical protein n=1 Tax=Romboutsia ilealis TaxID=1115758 RepID=UPI0026F3CA82|nr:hypothetical protein [Romboutsia ilealis]
MDKNTLDQANSIVRTINVLGDLNFVINRPYPQFSCNDKDVNSASFGGETLEQLKMTIKDFIGKRKLELQNEFSAL